jgi:hypothetical protein
MSRALISSLAFELSTLVGAAEVGGVPIQTRTRDVLDKAFAFLGADLEEPAPAAEPDQSGPAQPVEEPS